MIKLILYQKTSTFFNQFPAFDAPIKILTPDPLTADFVRASLSTGERHFEVISINQFLRSEMEQLLTGKNLVSKADLLMVLGTVFQRNFPEEKFEAFQKAFNTLTEFRAYSLDQTILSSIMEHFEEDLQKMVMLFHLMMEQLDLIDEHKAYHLLSEKLRTLDLPNDYPEKRTLVFYGFKFLTSVQLDFLQSLKIRNDVWIPFPEEVFEKSQENDWIKYLVPQEKILLKEKQTAIYPLKLIPFAQGRLAECLAEVEKKQSDFDLILAKPKLELEDVLITSRQMEYRIPHSLLENGLKFFEMKGKKEFFKLGKMNIPQFNEFLKKEKSKAIKNFDHRKVALLSLYQEGLTAWIALTDTLTSLGHFQFQILSEVVRLNLPRNYLHQVSSVSTGKILSFKNCFEVRSNAPLVFAATSIYGDMGGGEDKYNDELMNFLKKIGPVRRFEFEKNYLECQILEILTSRPSLVLMEEQLLHFNLSWSQFAQKLKAKNTLEESLKIPGKLPHYSNEPKNEKKIHEHISATELQTYLDCPRKYYVQYVERLNLKAELFEHLDSADIGTIVHEVVGTAVKENVGEAGWEKLIEKCLLGYCSKKKKNITPQDFRAYLLQIDAMAFDCTQELLNAQTQLGIQWKFEEPVVPVGNLPFKGSIDCFGQSGKKIFLLDMKSSTSMFTSRSIFKLEKIQIWFYLWFLKEKGILKEDSEIYFGYLSFKDLEGSPLYTFNEKYTLTEKLKFSSPKKLELKLEDVFSRLNQLWQDLLAENEFAVKPLNASACTYCAIEKICARGMNV